MFLSTLVNSERSKSKMQYRIVRHFFRSNRKITVCDRMTLAEAQEWCRDSNSSSRTATDKAGKARTRKSGPWFDGYTDK